jgi:general secretion pathway protein M
MTTTLSPPVSRALALAILIALLALGYYAIVQPILDAYAGQAQTIAQLQDALLRYRGATRDLPALEAQLASLKQRQATAEGFLQGPNDTLIAAQLQNRVKTLADGAHAELRSTQVLPTQEEGKMRRIAIRGQMAAPLPGIQQVFYGIESGSPLLFLDNVTMRVRPTPPRQANAPAGPEMIEVEFDVYGYANGSG